jgi:alpha-beta hydrolase superfamily lysophospholipase
VALLEALFLVLFWIFAASVALVLWALSPSHPPLPAAAASGHLALEPVRFQATDGVRLSGWKIPGGPGKPWILLCHPPHATRAALLDLAQQLARDGYGLFLFDFRGHGESQRCAISYGWLERHDLQGALAFLGRQADVPDRPYGIYAESSAAITATLLAAAGERLRAVVIRNPSDDPISPLLARLRQLLGITSPLRPLAALTYRLRFGVWPSQLATQQSLAQLDGARTRILTAMDDEKTITFFRDQLSVEHQAPR